LNWFEKEGWINKKSVKRFLEKNIRGFYLARENKLYAYKGVGFSFDRKTISDVLQKLPELKEKLNLNEKRNFILDQEILK